MRVYLATVGRCARRWIKELDVSDMRILISFAYMKRNEKLPTDKYKDILLDSGAFTFAFSSGAKSDVSRIDWKKYVEDYAACINANNIKHFMELDIDRIVGYQKVKELRDYLEHLTQKQCIPVWHINRGLDDYKEMVKNYKYVAIGGIRQEIGQRRFKYFKYLLDEAHRHGCRVHGLGFTRTNDLQNIPFDSVDSTSYMSGSRYGTVSIFNGKTITAKLSKRVDIQLRKSFLRCKNGHERQMFNLKPWYEFAKYAERNMGWKPEEQW